MSSRIKSLHGIEQLLARHASRSVSTRPQFVPSRLLPHHTGNFQHRHNLPRRPLLRLSHHSHWQMELWCHDPSTARSSHRLKQKR